MLALFAVLACARSEPSAPPPPPGPIVLGLHGMGDRPENFDQLWTPPPGFRELVPAAPEPYGQGYRWFPARREGIEDAAIADAADALAEDLQREGESLVVYGFSQGGAMTLALAVRHPERVQRGIAMGAWLPESLWAPPPEGAPPLLVLHGEADPIVPLEDARESVEGLRALGWDIELRTWPGVEHRITPEMAALLDEAIRCQGSELAVCAN